MHPERPRRGSLSPTAASPRTVLRLRRPWLLLAVAGALLLSPLSGQHGRAAADTADRLRSARARLDSILAGMRATSGERDALRAQLSQVLARLDATRRAFERQELQLTDLQARVEELSGRMEALQEQVNRRAAQVYTSGAAGGLELLLGTTSFRDLQDVAGFLARMAQSDRDAITALTTQRVELGRRRAAVDALRARLGSARAGLDAAGRDLTRRLGEQQVAMARLAQQRQEA